MPTSITRTTKHTKPTKQTKRLPSQTARPARSMTLGFLMVRVMVGAMTNFPLLVIAAQAAIKESK